MGPQRLSEQRLGPAASVAIRGIEQSDAALDCHCLKEIAAKGVCAPYEKEYLRKDGSHFDVDMSIRPLSFDGVPAMLVMAQDVTARNQAEKVRLLAEAQLRQAQKMEAVGQLTGGGFPNGIGGGFPSDTGATG